MWIKVREDKEFEQLVNIVFKFVGFFILVFQILIPDKLDLDVGK